MGCWSKIFVVFKKKCTIQETEVTVTEVLEELLEEIEPLSIRSNEIHPLLLDTVLKCVFQFLPFVDIKTCRLVCYKWNTIAEPMLKKRGKYKSSHSSEPLNFPENVFMKHLPELPSSLMLTSMKPWNDLEWQDFVENWLPNLKSLEFHELKEDNLKTKRGKMLTERLGKNPLLTFANNLVELIIADCSTPLLLFSDDIMASIKILLLRRCTIIANEVENRIKPWKFSLENVVFLRKGNKLKEITITDFVNFSESAEIKIINASSWCCRRSNIGAVYKITLDTERDVITARKMHFEGIRLLYNNVFHEALEYLNVSSCSIEIQEPDLVEIKKVITDDILLEPKKMEKIELPFHIYAPHLSNVPFKLICLPNLKHLKDHTGYSLKQFNHCSSLIHLDIARPISDCSFLGAFHIYLRDIPQSIKQLKLSPVKAMRILPKDGIRHLDILILDQCSKIPFVDAERIMKHLKPKVLVVILSEWMSSSDIISFISKNEHLEKLILKMPSAPHKGATSVKSISENSSLLYYQFNQFSGTALTEIEFNNFFTLE